MQPDGAPAKNLESPDSAGSEIFRPVLVHAHLGVEGGCIV